MECGEVGLENNEPDVAQSTFEQALGVSPGYPGAAVGLARCLVDASEIEAALDIIDQALEISPEHPKPWKTRAWLVQENGQKAEADEAWQTAEGLEP